MPTLASSASGNVRPTAEGEVYGPWIRVQRRGSRKRFVPALGRRLAVAAEAVPSSTREAHVVNGHLGKLDVITVQGLEDK
ncbi:hypothetical protein C4D60_Mb00t07080 [Musa balbisiana]|uniref:Uncharacterized protein n=1 Tax=Musa balbisiana TaxID=52838 RepID=A0A4S8I5L9_MUSBA|nr:hypothetical protein C4D60_Mb00t07080 [Musa balbisiana]